VTCAATTEAAHAVAKPNFEWYLGRSVEIIGALPAWLEELEAQDKSYDYLQRAAKAVARGRHKEVSFEDLLAQGAVISGSPDDLVQQARRYEEAGTDILLCLLNPYAVPHESCMETIELIGRHVIPEFS
jgi:alkanesulfonate monooxygenase SsuD/methylene tetrahydromethanopterin reductase-like flavin-dependent oxidoreductase (luciferase family)